MKLLLDNCVGVGARALFTGHEVVHVLDRGWDSLSNGKLIAAAAAGGFEVLVTVDKNLRHQQNIAELPISVLELDVTRNRMAELRALAPQFPAALEATRLYRFVSIRENGPMRLDGRIAPD